MQSGNTKQKYKAKHTKREYIAKIQSKHAKQKKYKAKYKANMQS
jgi:hypothetical protein